MTHRERSPALLLQQKLCASHRGAQAERGTLVIYFEKNSRKFRICLGNCTKRNCGNKKERFLNSLLYFILIILLFNNLFGYIYSSLMNVISFINTRTNNGMPIVASRLGTFRYISSLSKKTWGR